ncbi:cell wall hydrolase [uncultured Brevundimonas sp.]|uniref:cell wall hydrolase n=1 Tax=uncultured Brevundimonas sp. TaxID=213418 RepID=UPI002607CD73|nr:cell wall hydrolase [uncultured Brevundimonas sp.]
MEPRSTIAPPAYDPARARSGATGRGYTPPRLDLTTPPNIPSDPIACLTQAIYYEARNESEDGQAAVAEVVLNRAGSGRYPRDVCQVVYQRNSRTCQFTFTCDGSIGRSPVNMNAWARAERIARGVYAGETKALLPRASVNYHANYVSPTWARRMERVKRIGAHIFYGAPLNGETTPGADTLPPQNLMFVKNDAIERAYATLFRSSAPPPS